LTIYKEYDIIVSRVIIIILTIMWLQTINNKKGAFIMFYKECSVTGKVNLEKVWNFYENVSKWCEWDKNLDKVELQGDFKNGSTGLMFLTMPNTPPVTFTLENVIKNERFLSVSSLGAVTIMVDHLITQNIDKEVTIKHIVTVEGDNENMVQGIGTNLTNNLKECMENILLLSK